MLFDAHTHLNYEEFSEEERLDRAREIEESDVEFIIDVGDSVESSRQAIKDAADYSWCYAAVGIHPDKALAYSDDDIDKIKAFLYPHFHPEAACVSYLRRLRA